MWDLNPRLLNLYMSYRYFQAIRSSTPFSGVKELLPDKRKTFQFLKQRLTPIIFRFVMEIYETQGIL